MARAPPLFSCQDIVQKLKDTKQRIAETRKELKKSSFLLGNDEEDEDEDDEDIASSLRSKLTSALKDKLGGENSVEFIEVWRCGGASKQSLLILPIKLLLSSRVRLNPI